MPIQRPIEVFAASNTFFSLVQIKKAFDEIGDNFSFTWVIGQSNIPKAFKETKQERGRIDLFIVHFCDPVEEVVETVVKCFRLNLATFPTLFFVSCNGSEADCSEEKEQLDGALRMNSRDIVCISGNFQKEELEKALRKALPRFKFKLSAI